MPPPKKPKTPLPSGPANWEPAAKAVKEALNEWNVSIPKLRSLYVPFVLGQLSALPSLASKAMDTPQYHEGGWKEVGIKQNIDFLNLIRNDPGELKVFLGKLKVYLEKELGTLPLQPPPSPPPQPSLADQGFTPFQQPSSPEQQQPPPSSFLPPFYQQQQQPTFTSSPMEGGGGCLLPEQQFLFYQQQQLLLQQFFPPQPSPLPPDVCLALSHYYANSFGNSF